MVLATIHQSTHNWYISQVEQYHRFVVALSGTVDVEFLGDAMDRVWGVTAEQGWKANSFSYQMLSINKTMCFIVWLAPGDNNWPGTNQYVVGDHPLVPITAVTAQY